MSCRCCNLNVFWLSTEVFEDRGTCHVSMHIASLFRVAPLCILSASQKSSIVILKPLYLQSSTDHELISTPLHSKASRVFLCRQLSAFAIRTCSHTSPLYTFVPRDHSCSREFSFLNPTEILSIYARTLSICTHTVSMVTW